MISAAFRSRTLFAVAAAIVLSQASAAAGAQNALRSALAQSAFRGANLGVLVVRADNGQVLFEDGARRLLKPASNMKILTGVAALAILGPAHRFVTRVYSEAPPDAQGGVGSLMVRGGGDPSLTSEEWWRLAADLRAAGVRSVQGDIVLDDTAFGDDKWNAAWGARSARAFHAPVSALSANYGSFIVTVRPGGSPGGEARVTIDPSLPYLTLINQVRTVKARGAKGVSVDPRPGVQGETVVVGGSVMAGGEPEVVPRSVADPTRYAGGVLRMQLEANGITVGGGTRVERVPLDAREILAHDGMPLADILRLLMKYSNNNMTEMLLKDLGARDGASGSWESGLAASRAALSGLGVDLEGCTLVDGSGLAASNRVTPTALVSALRAARASFAFGPELLSSLPIAHRDGTLKRRAAGATDAVRAKTGLLSGATALSGIAHLRDGTEAVFSIIVNDYKSGDADVMAAIDAFVTTLVNADPREL